MEAYFSEIVVGLISTIGIPLAVYGIRYLHSLVKKTEFARKTQIDDFVFKVLESQVVTHMGRLTKAKKDKKAYKDLQVVAKQSTLSFLKVAAESKGIDLLKTYGTGMLEKLLHSVVKNVKSKL